MTIEEANEILNNFGYQESIRNGKKILGYHPVGYDMPLNYEVTVNLENETFSFFYAVPKSIVKVTLGPASPLSNKEHFKKMEQKFLEVINLIEKGK